MATETPLDEGEFPASRFQAIARDRSLAVPLALAGLILLALVVRFVLARRIVTPWIMVDELIYSELAKSFADGREFLLRDGPSPFHNVAYPTLIAPAWLAATVETSYGVARAINVALMVLAAVPVYFWGRRLMSPGHSLLAAGLVLLMPAFVYTGMLMTENAFFPAFVTTAFAIALALERPTLLRQALVLGLIGLTGAIRVQGVVLLPVLLIALALKLVLDLRAPDGPRGFRPVIGELRRYLPSAVALLVLGAGYVAYKARQGAGLETGLGAYAGVVKVEYDLSSAFEWIVDHFAELTLSVAVVPVSALIVLLGLGLRGWATTQAERAFVAVAASAFVLLAVQVGAYASRFSLRIEERNMFAAAPLLFLALCVWLARGLPRPRLLTAFAALAPAALLLSLDLRSLLNIGILSDTFTLIPLRRLGDLLDRGPDSIEKLMWLGGLTAALAFALLPRRFARVVLPSGVALFLVLTSWSVFGTIRDHARATLALTSPSAPSWIDEEIGTDSEAAFLYGATGDLFGEAQVMWQTEFWNRSVGTVYRLGPAEPAPLPEGVATFDRLSGRIALDQAIPPVRYVVAPASLELAGTLLAEHPRLALYRIEEPLRVETLLEGVYADGWMVTDASYNHYDRSTPGLGRIRVRVSRASWDRPTRPGGVTIRVGPVGSRDGQPAIQTVTASRSWTIRSGVGRTFTLPTPQPPYRLEIHVGSTFVPADYGESDPRQLGARVQVAVGS